MDGAVNYLKIYNQILERRQVSPYLGYTETHHIIPTCEGGSDTPENKVNLSGREHFIAHLLLYKIYKTYGLLKAVRAMQMDKFGERVVSRKYEFLKNEFSEAHSVFMKEYNRIHGNPFKDHKHTNETRKTISDKAKERFSDPTKNPFYGKKHKPQSIEIIKEKNRLSWKNGRKQPPRTDEHQENLRQSLLKARAEGRYKKPGPRTEEAKALSRIKSRAKLNKTPIVATSISDGKEYEFDYLYQCAEHVGASGTSNIMKALRDNNRSAYGHKWKYAS